MRAMFRRASPLRHLPPLLGFCVLLAACGGPSGYAPGPFGGGGAARPPHPIYKVGAPYQVNGVWYTPRADYRYDETGTASWYGEAFQGRYTANGEVFDLNDLSAAHRTLPLPSIVEVTNLRNGRMLRLRVNDRGPFSNSRILDVSRRAAQLLGFENAGTTLVRVRILPQESIQAAEAVIRDSKQNPTVVAAVDAPLRQSYAAELPEPRPYAPERPVTQPYAAERPPPEPYAAERPPPRYAAEERPASMPIAAQPPAPGPAIAQRMPAGPFSATPRLLFVQAGAYTRSDTAMRAVSAIAPLGNVAIVTTSESGNPVYRVQLGPVASGGEAETLRARLVDRGYAGARIVVN